MKITLVIPFFFFFTVLTKAQDPHFSQFYSNPIYLNPAYSGIKYCPNFHLNYRNQWPGLNKAYITYSASYDQYFTAINGGIAIMTMHDQAGNNTITTSTVDVVYAYHADITRNFKVQAALQASLFQKHLDWDKLTFGDMIDPRYGFIYTTQEAKKLNTLLHVDFSSGILAYSKKLQLGIAVHHLTQPEQSFLENPEGKLPLKFTAHAGILLHPKKGEKEISIFPKVVMMRQQHFQQFLFGFNARKQLLTGGLWYRWNDAFIAYFGINLNSWKVGYSYDITISKLGLTNTVGAHEISLQTTLKCSKTKPRTIKEYDCFEWD